MVTLLAVLLSQPYNLNLQPPSFYACSGSVTCTRVGPWLNIVGSGGGGGSGAPVDGGYVVWTSVGSTNERLLTAGTNITLDTATPGQIIVNASSGGSGYSPDGGFVRMYTRTGYTGTGTGATSIPMPDFTFDAGVIGASFVYRCNLVTAVDGGAATGIRISVRGGITASELRTSSLEYCSTATARAAIGGSLTAATVDFAPTGSQGNIPCVFRFERMFRNVTGVGQVLVYAYSELASPNQVTVFPGSYCEVEHF